MEEKNEQQKALEKAEKKIQKEKRLAERKRKSDQEVDQLFRTESFGIEDILSALAKPLLLPPFPSNTQRVDQMVRVVTEAAMTRVSYDGRQTLIVQKLKSRKLVKSLGIFCHYTATGGGYNHYQRLYPFHP